MKRDDVYYQALLARDPRFDGKFFIGVKTTGIYCRPICPAKPKRENVVFFSSPHAAENAGFRPCLRCRPESAPQSPAWMGSSALVRRAIKLLQTSTSHSLNEDEFAERLGVSARHLRRLFQMEIGKSPKQLLIEHRLGLARHLIVETSLPITEVAFAAGFRSVRRFNDAFQKRFHRSPRLLRRGQRSHEAPLRISLSYRPPFDFAGLLHFYERHQVGRLERYEAERVHRVVEIQGKIGRISVSNEEDRSRVLVDIDFPDVSLIHVIVSRVRSWLDLDSDPVIIANSMEVDRGLKKLSRRHQGIRLPTGWDPYEVAVGTILGQLVSVERGRSLVNDLIDLIARKSGLSEEGKPVFLFPTPAQVAAADLSTLKTTGTRRRALIEFSRAVAEGKLSLESTQDVDQFVEKLLKIRGIGPWTAQYMALKVLKNTDSFPATDLILARALVHHPLTTIDRMRPWRGYAAALLWKEYASSPIINRRSL